MSTSKLKVLGIACSPRKNGNSEYLLEQALEEASSVYSNRVETRLYSFRGKRFSPCIACAKCIELGGECVQKDSFQELRDEWIKGDVIIYSVPVYHMGIPGQLKCFIDRLGMSLFARNGMIMPKYGKMIGVIAQGAHLFSGQEHAMTDIINHALLVGCLPISGDSWESYIGAGGWTFDEPDENALRRHYENGDQDAVVAVKGARSVTRRAVQFASMLKAGAKLQRKMLENEKVLNPLLERL